MQPRVLVLSPDDGFGLRVAAGLPGTLGHVEVHRAWSEDIAYPPPVLSLIQAGDEPLPACGPVIAMAPGAGLAAVVALLQASPDVAAVIAGHGLAPRQLVALSQRVITGQLSGLDGALGPGAEVFGLRVGDHDDKVGCMAQVAALAERARLPTTLRASIEQCLDELVTNALYAAPIDARGRAVFAGVSPRARRMLRTDHEVTVQYAWDGARFALAVRDAFGTLDRATVLRRLANGVHTARPAGVPGEGAGLGLYLIAQAATAVCFHVVPGIATEVLCVFELGAPAGAIAQLGLIHSAPAGRTGTGAARRRLTRAGARRRTTLALGTTAAMAVIAAGGLAGAHARAKAAEIPEEPVTRAPTPPPAPPPADAVMVRFVSTPPGARIVEAGAPPSADHTYTPAEIPVAVNREHRFVLTMPGHAALTLAPFTPTHGASVPEQGGELATTAETPSK